MEEEYRLKYLNSGVFFAFALATTFLPLLLGIESFSIVILGIALLTFLNYVYIALLKDSRLRRFNPFVLIPLNILLMFLSVAGILPLPWEVEGMVFAFSVFFLWIPWFFFIIIAGVSHDKYCRNPQQPPKGW